MHDHMGWSHYLGARSDGPNNYVPGVNFPQIYEGLDYAAYEQHKPMYDAYVATLDARPGKPAWEIPETSTPAAELYGSSANATWPAGRSRWPPP